MTGISLRSCHRNEAGGQESVPLRSYQAEAVDALMAQRLNRDSVPVISLPTGAGKTRVLVEFIARLIADNPSIRILLLAPNWEILGQIFEALAAIRPDLAEQAGRIGGGKKCLRRLRETGDCKIYLTTLHTWHNRHVAGRLPAGLSGTELVVIKDESHWAMNAQLGESLRQAYLGKALMVGCSATPNVEFGGKYSVAYHKSYADLCPEYLARPLVREVQTGVEWEPIVRNGVISPSSLRRLGHERTRNQLVVEECVSGLRDRRYQKILIYACDIGHANHLRDELLATGVAVEAYHSKQPEASNQAALRDFRSGSLDVLVTVQMATMGINVPEIDAIFLSRPTESLVLLAQMIGRGCRKLPSKDIYWIVEFTDNVQRMASHIFHAEDYLREAAGMPVRRRSYVPIRRHFEPPDDTQFDTLQLPGLAPLTFLAGQTFGVEIELTCPGDAPPSRSRVWRSQAREIIERLQSAAAAPVHPDPVGYHGCQDPTHWYVSYDSSAGWEIVSPILADAPGFVELMHVTEALRRLVANSANLCVNHRTGLHVTIATELETVGRQQRLAGLVTRLEPALYTLVSPSRLYEFDGKRYVRRASNQYCQSVRQALQSWAPSDRSAAIRDLSRYHSVNFTKLQMQPRLLEVRMHNGTVDYRKIVPWICLWMHIISRSRFDCSGEIEVGRPFRSGNRRVTQRFADREDIVKRLPEEGIVLGPEFLEVLQERRVQLRPFWSKVLPMRVAGWERAGWYGVHEAGVVTTAPGLAEGQNIETPQPVQTV